MKKKEMREVTVIYCDYCKKEIAPPYSSIKYPDGKIVDLCSSYNYSKKTTCKDKYENEQQS